MMRYTARGERYCPACQPWMVHIDQLDQRVTLLEINQVMDAPPDTETDTKEMTPVQPILPEPENKKATLMQLALCVVVIYGLSVLAVAYTAGRSMAPAQTPPAARYPAQVAPDTRFHPTPAVPTAPPTTWPTERE